VSELDEKEQLEVAKGWLRENGLWIAGGIAIGALILGGWNWWHARRDAQAETASARYTEAVAAYGRGDPARGQQLVDEINREYAWTPYAALGTLVSVRAHVEANELDQAAAGLKSVMDTAPDKDIRLAARVRLARVQAAQSKYDEALATLNFPEAGVFAPRFADARGDVLLAKGDRAGALKEYLAARTSDTLGRVDNELLDLKIRDLGGTPPKTPEEPAPQES
jgi:predicted negative regulator of RcsB-dependent stress response